MCDPETDEVVENINPNTLILQLNLQALVHLVPPPNANVWLLQNPWTLMAWTMDHHPFSREPKRQRYIYFLPSSLWLDDLLFVFSTSDSKWLSPRLVASQTPLPQYAVGAWGQWLWCQVFCLQLLWWDSALLWLFRECCLVWNVCY